MERLLAVCSPGLEPFVAKELRGLGWKDIGSPWPPKPDGGPGGVEFQGSLPDIHRANLLLRCADRVLVRLGEFRVHGFPELRRIASRMPWERYLSPGRPIAFRVSCRRSKLYHERAVAERLAGAIADRAGKPPRVQPFHDDSGTPLPQLVVVRLEDDLCAVSMDSSGALLHRRGYRLAATKAPLRETLAAAMVMASGWDQASPLLDPFCGSGAIPIEAALLARKVPPGHSRRFAFMDWPGFDPKAWDKTLAEARKGMAQAGPRIIASDRDAGAIQAARANAERAGVADAIEFSCRAVSAVEAQAAPGWVVTNPPYGVRLAKTGDLRDLYAQLGKVLRARCPGWQATMLAADRRLLRCTGWDFESVASTMNGGLKVELVSRLA
ncbi:MAG: class I SAM-dependent RNA methyltransferase [Elusimicrobia bacterium]|nr:class I SAM-dependent RNA methyltransferase [Elusimicrobiota bacterium]